MGKELVGVLISIGVLVRDDGGSRNLACHSGALRRLGATAGPELYRILNLLATPVGCETRTGLTPQFVVKVATN